MLRNLLLLLMSVTLISCNQPDVPKGTPTTLNETSDGMHPTKIPTSNNVRPTPINIELVIKIGTLGPLYNSYDMLTVLQYQDALHLLSERQKQDIIDRTRENLNVETIMHAGGGREDIVMNLSSTVTILTIFNQPLPDPKPFLELLAQTQTKDGLFRESILAAKVIKGEADPIYGATPGNGPHMAWSYNAVKLYQAWGVPVPNIEALKATTLQAWEDETHKQWDLGYPKHDELWINDKVRTVSVEARILRLLYLIDPQNELFTTGKGWQTIADDFKYTNQNAPDPIDGDPFELSIPIMLAMDLNIPKEYWFENGLLDYDDLNYVLDTQHNDGGFSVLNFIYDREDRTVKTFDTESLVVMSRISHYFDYRPYNRDALLRYVMANYIGDRGQPGYFLPVGVYLDNYTPMPIETRTDNMRK